MPVLVFKLGIVPYNLLNIMNQEDKELRDRIAIEAMKVLLAADPLINRDVLAIRSYAVANAMVKERSE
jgi:hypothetical protein